MAARSRQPSAPPEGRAWWLELQRQRTAGASQDGSPLAGEPAGICTEAQEQDELARRRATLLYASQTLLRRMHRPQQRSRQTDSSGGRHVAVSSAAAGSSAVAPAAAASGTPTMTSGTPTMTAHAPSAAAPTGPSPAARPAAAERRAGSQGAERPAASDMQQMNRLLEGGIIGRAMAASAAWHKTKAALQQQELGEWRLLRGESLGRSAAAGSSFNAISAVSAANSRMAGSAGCGEGTVAGTSGAAAATSGDVVAGSTAQHAQRSLPPLHEDRELDTADQVQEAGGQEASRPDLPNDLPCRRQLFDCATAEVLIAAFADAEVREYLQQQVAALDPPHSSGHRVGGAAAAGSAAAGIEAVPTAALPQLSAEAASPSPCCPARLGPAPLPAAASADDSTAAGAGRTSDPVLAAWMVTRAPPDLPVRGYAAPPSRATCRLVAAQEMRSFYKREQRRQGSFFRWSGLTKEQASGRGSGGAPMQLAPERAAAPAPHKTLKGLVRRNLMLKHLGDMAQQSKAAVWAQQHAQQMEAEAGQRLQQQQAEAAAADKARKAAAAAAARRALLGTKAGDGFAAVVQLAKQVQAQQQEAGAAGSDGSGARPRGSPNAAQRGRALPALHLQKLTEHWHRTAAAAAAAAGEQTARQRRDAAAREQLRQQWAAVKGRLRDAAT